MVFSQHSPINLFFLAAAPNSHPLDGLPLARFRVPCLTEISRNRGNSWESVEQWGRRDISPWESQQQVHLRNSEGFSTPFSLRSMSCTNSLGNGSGASTTSRRIEAWILSPIGHKSYEQDLMLEIIWRLSAQIYIR